VEGAVQASARIRPIAPSAKKALPADAPPERALVRTDADALSALVPGAARPDEHHASVPPSPEEADIPRAEVVLELGVRLPADDAPFDDRSGPPQTVPHGRAGHAELDRADPDAVLDREALRGRPSRRRRSYDGDHGDLLKDLNLTPFYARLYRPGSDHVHFSLQIAIDELRGVENVTLEHGDRQLADEALRLAILTYGVLLLHSEKTVQHGLAASALERTKAVLERIGRARSTGVRAAALNASSPRPATSIARAKSSGCPGTARIALTASRRPSRTRDAAAPTSDSAPNGRRVDTV
jgi:hypothetical protein